MSTFRNKWLRIRSAEGTTIDDKSQLAYTVVHTQHLSSVKAFVGSVVEAIMVHQLYSNVSCTRLL